MELLDLELLHLSNISFVRLLYPMQLTFSLLYSRFKDFLLESVEAQPIFFLLHTILQITDILVLSTTIKDPMTHKNLECSATDSYYLQSVA